MRVIRQIVRLVCLIPLRLSAEFFVSFFFGGVGRRPKMNPALQKNFIPAKTHAPLPCCRGKNQPSWSLLMSIQSLLSTRRSLPRIMMMRNWFIWERCISKTRAQSTRTASVFPNEPQKRASVSVDSMS